MIIEIYQWKPKAMVRSTFGRLPTHSIRNEVIRKRTGVIDIIRKISEIKWRLVGHAIRQKNKKCTIRAIQQRHRETKKAEEGHKNARQMTQRKYKVPNSTKSTEMEELRRGLCPDIDRRMLRKKKRKICIYLQWNIIIQLSITNENFSKLLRRTSQNYVKVFLSRYVSLIMFKAFLL